MRRNPRIFGQPRGQAANIAVACILAALIGSAAAQQEQTGANATGALSPSTSETGSATGLRTITAPDSLHLDFYKVHDNDLRASDLIGMAVYNLENEKVGLINDVILADGKLVKAVVISVGGFLGVGNRDVAVAADSLVIQKQGGQFERAVVNTTKESLQNAEPFKFRSKLSQSDETSSGFSATTGSAGSSARAAALVRPQ